MQIYFTGKNVDVTDPMRAYAQKKMDHLTRYMASVIDAQVTFSTQRNWQIVEVSLEGDGVFLRGEERTSDMYASIDAVVDKLEKQIKRFKGKLRQRRTDAPAAPDAADDDVEAEEEPAEGDEPLPNLVRTKRFAVKPMSPEEAALQMELLNHDFFMFQNQDTGQVNVVYRRRDGDHGLIEPDF